MIIPVLPLVGSGFAAVTNNSKILVVEDHSESVIAPPDSAELILRMQVKFKSTTCVSSFQNQSDGTPPPLLSWGLPFSWQMTGAQEAGRHIQVLLKPLLRLYSVGSAHIPFAKACHVTKPKISGVRKYFLQMVEQKANICKAMIWSSMMSNTPQIHPLLSITMAPTLVQVTIISQLDVHTAYQLSACLPWFLQSVLHKGARMIC